jgi:uncharacterized delta-60 repeat protein
VLSDDSIVVRGYFEGVETFGPVEGNETVFSSAGYADIFISRYNPDGTLHWARRARGTKTNTGKAISVLSDDSIVVSGDFYGTVTFGPGEGNETVLSSAGSYDIFIARYNADGTLHWAKRAGGTDCNFSPAISVLSDDSIAVTGYFKGTAAFGPGEDNETMLSSMCSSDIFIARYNADGTLHWARRAGGDYSEECYAISVLSDDSIAVTGWFEGTTTFGPGEDNETVLSSAGYINIFIARYNPNGTLHWARRAGGRGFDKGHAISVLSDDSIVASGTFGYSATFGSGEDNETVLFAASEEGECDIFIACYNPDGTLHRVRRAGGTGNDCGFAISVLSDDSIAVSGVFIGAATFGPGEINETVLDSAGGYDIFIARYNK